MKSTPSSSTDARPVPAVGPLGAAATDGGSPAAGPWLQVVVAREILRRNMALFRERVRPPARLLAVVKANGYGHGLLVAARAFLEGGADMLGVHAVAEARNLRQSGIAVPVLVLGPASCQEAALASQLGVELTVGSLAGLAAAAAAVARDASLRVHLKVETGVWRQGLLAEELGEASQMLAAAPQLQLVGLSSHFADIEDTTDRTFAQQQSERFEFFSQALAARGHQDLCHHMSCSASAILWQKSHRDLVRVGIAGYGIWPSRETLISARQAGHQPLPLAPALTWTCRVAQVKPIPAGQSVGYGRTWKAPVDGRIAVLPVGYSDGYPRALSNRAQVLIHGKRAPVRGRICMNLCMVDVTHIPEAAAGDQAVLLGRQQQEEISASELAELLHTIPYEILTLPGPSWSWAEV